MSQPPEDKPSLEADFEAIAAAVNETERGRWFLAEYNRRNRYADTQIVLDAIAKLQAGLAERAGTVSTEHFRHEIAGMSEAIARTKAEIAAIKPQGEGLGKIGDATLELDAIVETTERATSDILAASERVQEIAWTLREQGVDPNVCDLLDLHTTQTYTACSFQDLTGQRIRKIVNVLNFLEERIEAMNRIWQRHEVAPSTTTTSEIESSLTSGPARPGEGLEQVTIDGILETPEPPEVDPAEDICWQDAPIEGDASRSEAAPAVADQMTEEMAELLQPEPAALEKTASEPAAPSSLTVSRPNAKAAAPASDPIEALTPAERLALFS